VAPTYLVEELAHVIMMVFHLQLAFDQVGDSLCRPEFRSVTMGYGPFGQEPNEAFLLFRSQARWSTRRRFGGERFFPTVLERIAPSKDAACVTTHASRNLMKGQVLFEECYDMFSTLFQRLRRAMRSHGDTPFQDASILLHYLCGCQ